MSGTPISFQRRLMLLVGGVTGLALLTALLGIGIYASASYRESLRYRRSSEAAIVAHNVASAIVFEDDDHAQTTLESLTRDDGVVMACLYRRSGALFVAQPEGARCPTAPPPKAGFRSQHLDSLAPATFQGSEVGQLLVVSSTKRLDARLQRFAAIAIATLGGALLLALVLSAWFQRQLTEPVRELVAAAGRVRDAGDYSVRARRFRDDELGELTTTFNAMLDRIETANEELSASEARYRGLYNTPLAGMMRIHLTTGAVLVANDASARFLGYGSVKEMERAFDARKHFAEPRNALPLLEELRARGSFQKRELAWQTLDRKPRWGLVSGALDGDKVELVFVDITARKEAETTVAALEEQVRHQHKLEAIGTLASGVAHEINNPVQAIVGTCELLQLDRPEDAHLADNLGVVLEHSDRIARIVRSLLAFARRDGEDAEPEDPGAILGETVDLIAAVIRRSRVQIRIDADANLPKVRCKRQQVQQVLMNLITNARDAIDGAKLEDDRRVIVVRAAKDDESVRFEVEDRGPGIPDDVVERIFDPFFTTKGRRNGTGLGLSVSFGIIKDHGGVLRVTTQPGRTAFSFDLPTTGSPGGSEARSASEPMAS